MAARKSRIELQFSPFKTNIKRTLEAEGFICTPCINFDDCSAIRVCGVTAKADLLNSLRGIIFNNVLFITATFCWYANHDCYMFLFIVVPTLLMKTFEIEFDISIFLIPIQ